MTTWLVTGGAGFIGGNFVLDAVGRGIKVVIRAHGLVFAEGGGIATHGRGHTQARVAVHVVGAQARFPDLVGQIGFFRQGLAGAVVGDRAGAVFGQHLLEAGGGEVHGFFP